MVDQALDIEPVVDWLIQGARPSRLPGDVLLDTCRRTVAAGLPLYRVGVFVRTLHPNVLGRAFIWQADKGAVEMTEAAHDLLESEVFLKSPIRVVFNEHVEVRRRLADASCPIDFPILEDLRREGATDFIAAPLRFGIGLHLGEVTYGNIGTPTRIEFTVIGAAANEAARIESLCKVLGANVLVSERVVQALPHFSWRSLGSHTLRGVGDKMELFTLR